MNSIDDTLIVLRDEIEEIFFKQFGDKSFNKTGEKIKSMLFDAGELLYTKLGKEIALNCILGQYIYYLDNHFYNLMDSFLTNQRQNTDIYKRLNQKKYGDPIYFFFKYGIFCFLLMSKEMQKTIFIERRYDLFWDELYHFQTRLEFEYEKSEFERYQQMISELEEKKLINVPNYSNFFTGNKINKNKGRPSKITIEILMKFADYLDENRKEKKHTLKELLEMAAENKMDPTAIRNWLRNRLPLLHEPGKTVEELSKNDIIYMWKESQKVKNR